MSENYSSLNIIVKSKTLFDLLIKYKPKEIYGVEMIDFDNPKVVNESKLDEEEYDDSGDYDDDDFNEDEWNYGRCFYDYSEHTFSYEEDDVDTINHLNRLATLDDLFSYLKMRLRDTFIESSNERTFEIEFDKNINKIKNDLKLALVWAFDNGLAVRNETYESMFKKLYPSENYVDAGWLTRDTYFLFIRFEKQDFQLSYDLINFDFNKSENQNDKNNYLPCFDQVIPNTFSLSEQSEKSKDLKTMTFKNDQDQCFSVEIYSRNMEELRPQDVKYLYLDECSAKDPNKTLEKVNITYAYIRDDMITNPHTQIVISEGRSKTVTTEKESKKTYIAEVKFSNNSVYNYNSKIKIQIGDYVKVEGKMSNEVGTVIGFKKGWDKRDFMREIIGLSDSTQQGISSDKHDETTKSKLENPSVAVVSKEEIKKSFFDKANKLVASYPDAHISGDYVAEITIASSILHEIIRSHEIKKHPNEYKLFDQFSPTQLISKPNTNEVILRGCLTESVDFQPFDSRESCFSFFINNIEDMFFKSNQVKKLIDDLNREKKNILNEISLMNFVYYDSFLFGLNEGDSYIVDILEDIDSTLKLQDWMGYSRVIGYHYEYANDDSHVTFMDKLLMKTFQKHSEWQDFPVHLYKRPKSYEKVEMISLEDASDLLKNDKPFVLEAVKRDGDNLFYASQALQNDKEVAMEAVMNKGYMITYLYEKLKKDKDILNAAAHSDHFPVVDGSKLHVVKLTGLKYGNPNGTIYTYASLPMQYDKGDLATTLQKRVFENEVTFYSSDPKLVIEETKLTNISDLGFEVKFLVEVGERILSKKEIDKMIVDYSINNKSFNQIDSLSKLDFKPYRLSLNEQGKIGIIKATLGKAGKKEYIFGSNGLDVKKGNSITVGYPEESIQAKAISDVFYVHSSQLDFPLSRLCFVVPDGILKELPKEFVKSLNKTSEGEKQP
jgi:hypothetical protein